MVYATLGELACFPGGAEVVFDYANPPGGIKDDRARAFQDEMAAEVAASGEPFRSYLETPELHLRGRALGYMEIEDLDGAALFARYLPQVPKRPRPGLGGHVVRLATR